MDLRVAAFQCQVYKNLKLTFTLLFLWIKKNSFKNIPPSLSSSSKCPPPTFPLVHTILHITQVPHFPFFFILNKILLPTYFPTSLWVMVSVWKFHHFATYLQHLAKKFSDTKSFEATEKPKGECIS